MRTPGVFRSGAFPPRGPGTAGSPAPEWRGPPGRRAGPDSLERLESHLTGHVQGCLVAETGEDLDEPLSVLVDAVTRHVGWIQPDVGMIRRCCSANSSPRIRGAPRSVSCVLAVRRFDVPSGYPRCRPSSEVAPARALSGGGSLRGARPADRGLWRWRIRGHVLPRHDAREREREHAVGTAGARGDQSRRWAPRFLAGPRDRGQGDWRQDLVGRRWRRP
jgi:hypothetical protein